MSDWRLAKEVREVMNRETPRTETQLRQEIFRLCMNGKPADVAKWLREMADDIEGLGE